MNLKPQRTTVRSKTSLTPVRPGPRIWRALVGGSVLRRCLVFSVATHLLLLVSVTVLARPRFIPRKIDSIPVNLISFQNLPAPDPAPTRRAAQQKEAPANAAMELPKPVTEAKKTPAKKAPELPKPEAPKPEAPKTKPPAPKAAEKAVEQTQPRNAPKDAPQETPKPGATTNDQILKTDLPKIGDAVANLSMKVDGSIEPWMYYLRLVQQEIAREWDPPVSASTRQGEATASLRFRIGRDGSVAQSTVSVGEPSGDYLFDQSMVRALQAAGNLPPLPPEYPEETLGLEIIFLYQP
ncbi:MAG: TonB family protein [Candidatus Eisenbacteria bacterium]|nr:TonB family protein [Candidatus Eisenbacteria bacterium]